MVAHSDLPVGLKISPFHSEFQIYDGRNTLWGLELLLGIYSSGNGHNKHFQPVNTESLFYLGAFDIWYSVLTDLTSVLTGFIIQASLKQPSASVQWKALYNCFPNKRGLVLLNRHCLFLKGSCDS